MQKKMSGMIERCAQENRRGTVDYLLEKLAPIGEVRPPLESTIESSLTEKLLDVSFESDFLNVLPHISRGMARSRQGSSLARYCQAYLESAVPSYALLKSPHQAVNILLSAGCEAGASRNPDFDEAAVSVLERASRVPEKTWQADEGNHSIFYTFTKGIQNPSPALTKAIDAVRPYFERPAAGQAGDAEAPPSP